MVHDVRLRSRVPPGGAVACFWENLFPPIPSEVILPFAGFLTAGAGLSLPLMVAAATLGAVAGTLPFYCLGRARVSWSLPHMQP